MSFHVQDCALIVRMAGVDTALNLRELRERLLICPVECLFHHFCETHIRPSFDDPEFRNDFALWAARELQDRILAERLGIINPYTFTDLEKLRLDVVEIVDERLSEIDYVPWVHKDKGFRFMQAVTVVFSTGMQIHQPQDLGTAVMEMSLSTIYYHFIEARRRTVDRLDDFSRWLIEYGDETAPIVRSLSSIDFYYMSLPELQRHLIEALHVMSTEYTHG